MGGVGQIAMGAAQLLAPEALARIMLDPTFANQIYEASRAANAGNMVRFNRLMTSIDSSLKNDKEDEE